MRKIFLVIVSFIFYFFIPSQSFAVSVSSWSDKSGNNETLLQSVNANMPTSGVSTINGLNTISFPGTGSDGYLVTGDQNFSRLLNAAHTMFFIQYTSNPSANIFDLWSGSSTPFWNFQNSGIFWDWNYPNAGRIQVSTPSAVTHLWNLNVTPSSSRFVNLDGTNVGSAATSAATAYACPFAMGDAAGCAQNHGSLPWTGQTGELLLYNSALSVTNYQLVEGYLAWKWGTQSLLPAAHPYKSAAPVGFNPKTSVSGLSAWYDASDAATINNLSYVPVVSGNIYSGKISTWNDLSGNNENLVQKTVASQPSVSYSGSTNVGAVNFDGVSSYMLSSDTNFSRLTAPSVSIFAVLNGANDTQTADPINTTNTINSVYTQLLIPYSSNIYFDIGSYQTHRVTVGTSGVGQNIWTAVGSDGGTSLIDKNGTQIVSGTLGAQEATYACPLSIGALTVCGTSPAYYYNGSMSEVLIYNKQLSISDYQKIEGYLAWRWGLQGNLPLTHPYRNRPPFGGSPLSVITTSPSAWYDANNILGSFSALLGGSFNYQTSKIYLPLGFSTGAVSTSTQYTVQPVVNYTNGQLTGLRAAGSTTDNGTTVFTAYKNGISIGTIGFANGSKVASAIFSAPVFISANDVLTLQCTTAGTIQNVEVAAEGTQQDI